MSNIEHQKQMLQYFDVPGNKRIARQRATSAGKPETGTTTPVVFSSLPPGIPKLKRGILFSIFDKEQREEATRVASFLMKSKDYQQFNNNVSSLRPLLNETLFVYAISLAIVHGPFTRGLQIPPIWQVLPHHFFDLKINREFNDEIEIRKDETSTEDKTPIKIALKPTGNIRDVEYKVAYFREDISLNSHHWHWHLLYPSSSTGDQLPVKDRKGELFYYMHQQMLAHYDAERFSNGISRVQTLHNYDEAVQEGYMPNLFSKVAGREYGGRPANLRMRDLPDITINSLETSRERILQAVNLGFIILVDGKQQDIRNEKGIDILGDLIESSDYSLNQSYYGDLHNSGHVVISRMHDPDERYNSSSGVMSYVETAIRDPIFFRWHKHIDMIFQDHKRSLPMYTDKELKLQNIEITSAEVISDQTTEKKNTLYTYFETRDINLSKGMDFGRTGEQIIVTITHLQHEEFQFTLKVNNTTGKEFNATFRIFLAPKYNDLGLIMNLNEQRTLMMEMDKFQLKLSDGENIITRKSTDSNVTLKSETMWEVIENRDTTDGDPRNYCGCGWPHHLLIPKGKALGMDFQMFVMITNFEEDKVNASPTSIVNPQFVTKVPSKRPRNEPQRNRPRSQHDPSKRMRISHNTYEKNKVKSKGENHCLDAVSYCGIANDLYPDKKPMGFPFDREIRDSIEQFASRTNMKFFDVSIVHRLSLQEARTA